MKEAMTNLQEVIEAGKAWELAESDRARRSERRAWLVAGGAGALSLVLGIALAGLTPLKDVQPFVVRVDNNTGATDIVTVLKEQSLTYDEAIDKYFLARYVNVREEYSDATAFANYRAVSLMSIKPIAESYYAVVKPDNPLSPIKVYGSTGAVQVAINNIAFIEPGLAQIRFTRLEQSKQGSQAETRWIATVGYRYLNPPLAEPDRLINPVGFQVREYRLDPETLTVN